MVISAPASAMAIAAIIPPRPAPTMPTLSLPAFRSRAAMILVRVFAMSVQEFAGKHLKETIEKWARGFTPYMR